MEETCNHHSNIRIPHTLTFSTNFLYMYLLVLVFGFDNATYQVREDEGEVRTSVSLLGGDPGEWEVLLTVATEDLHSNATAQGNI